MEDIAFYEVGRSHGTKLLGFLPSILNRQFHSVLVLNLKNAKYLEVLDCLVRLLGSINH